MPKDEPNYKKLDGNIKGGVIALIGIGLIKGLDSFGDVVKFKMQTTAEYLKHNCASYAGPLRQARINSGKISPLQDPNKKNFDQIQDLDKTVKSFDQLCGFDNLGHVKLQRGSQNYFSILAPFSLHSIISEVMRYGKS